MEDVCKEIHGIVYGQSFIAGHVYAEGQIGGTVSSEHSISGRINYRACGQTEIYDGDYEVIPKVTAQELETREKLMADDVLVHAIPYFETSNQSGTTVYIANEV